MVLERELQIQLGRLKQALEIHRQALEGLESALLEFEEALIGQSSTRPQERKSVELLSIAELCQELGMGKTWVYRRIRSGELPSVKLGHNVKVRREDLEEYLQRHTHRLTDEDLLSGEDQPLH